MGKKFLWGREGHRQRRAKNRPKGVAITGPQDRFTPPCQGVLPLWLFRSLPGTKAHTPSYPFTKPYSPGSQLLY